MEFGIYTFAEATPVAGTGERISPRERMSNLLEEVALADQAGLDIYAIGEHHRPEYLSSAPAVILAAAAARTRNIRLSSAVTVLGSDDPVRVFQDFATLDLLSGGRAEIMAGRGSFIESFPLFGYDLSSYDELFAEKLELLLELREKEIIEWSGTHRPSIEGRGVYPRPVQEKLPVWLAVGGTPESAVRAGSLGLPMALGIIGGTPSRFTTFAQLHRNAAERAGYGRLPLGINSHGFIADTWKEAADTSFPAFKQVMDRLGRERGWPPMSRQQFDDSTSLQGANVVGSPEQVVDKVLHQHELFEHDRFLLQFTVGTIPHKKVMRSIELFGEKVAPAIRKALTPSPEGRS